MTKCSHVRGRLIRNFNIWSLKLNSFFTFIKEFKQWKPNPVTFLKPPGTIISTGNYKQMMK